MSEEHESSEPTSGDDVTLRPLSPSETESPERRGAFTVSHLFSSRAILTKILAIVSFVLFIICIALIAVLVQEKKSGSTIAQQTDNKGKLQAIKKSFSARCCMSLREDWYHYRLNMY